MIRSIRARLYWYLWKVLIDVDWIPDSVVFLFGLPDHDLEWLDHLDDVKRHLPEIEAAERAHFDFDGEVLRLRRAIGDFSDPTGP